MAEDHTIINFVLCQECTSQSHRTIW